MSNTIDWQTITAHVSDITGQPFEIQTRYGVGGGCINQAYRIEGAGKNYFVKLNHVACENMFIAEATGLTELAQTNRVRVPLPMCVGTTSEHAYLVMEYISLRSSTQTSSGLMGTQLAALHQVTNTTFGWLRHNYIGSTPQINTSETDWVTFWREHRLKFQLDLAAKHGHGGKLQTQGELLLADLGDFFTTYKPVASLLHGDLWSGNYGADAQDHPVIFDPAIYYGDREADLAMTELFGGFSTRFYEMYQEAYPLDDGYDVRKNLYNLYHIINHLNLFGGSYLEQATRMIEALLIELH